MKRRDFIKKAGIGAAAVAATSVNAPFADAKQKGIVDFALDIYNANQSNIKQRLATGWQNAIGDDNPVDKLYLFFRLEGYDVTLGDCVKIVEAYQKMKDYPPWQDAQGGPVAY